MAKRFAEIELDGVSFPGALNYYSQTFKFDKSKEWALQWLAKKDAELGEKLKDVPSERFSNRGFVCRLSERNYPLVDIHYTKLMKFFQDMLDEKTQASRIVPDEKPKKNQSKKINNVLCQLDDEIDNIMSDRAVGTIEIPVDRASLSESRVWCENQLVELYEQIAKLENVAELVADTFSRCGGIVESMRRKKPIRKKAANKSEKMDAAWNAIKKMRYQKEDKLLGVKSLSPATIVNSNVVIVFNTKYRMAIKYQAAAGETLDIKGASIVNYQPDLSSKRRVRKPAEFLACKDMVGKYNLLTTKTMELFPPPRMTADSMIVYAG
jgi:hypothetical protein